MPTKVALRRARCKGRENSSTDPPALAPLLDGSRPAPGSAAVAALQPAFDAALRLENPTLRNVETTDCVSCHQAEGAGRVGKDLYALSTATSVLVADRMAGLIGPK